MKAGRFEHSAHDALHRLTLCTLHIIMPWLLKPHGNDSLTALDNECLLFVHVPRCGGTSLTQHFDLQQKCMEGRTLWKRVGMSYFFYRYKVLESANFPIHTRESLVAVLLCLSGVAYTVFSKNDSSRLLGGAIGVASILVFLLPAFVFTAPVIGRITWIRRPYLYLVHYVLCQFMESIDWLMGTNRTGYMMHLTAQKLLQHGYVTPEQMDNVHSMALVRNPYSRMVSIYHYNRFGPTESFWNFVQRWFILMKHYRERGETDEWFTPCHCLPQHEFTHYQGKQLVQSVVKQEELKYLKNLADMDKAVAQDSTVADLPELVREALLGMPHANKRSSGTNWWDYYDQVSLNKTFELYQADFYVFGYNAKLEQRPDLQPPRIPRDVQQRWQRMSRNSSLVQGHRVSKLLLLQDACSTQTALLSQSSTDGSGSSISSRSSLLGSDESPRDFDLHQRRASSKYE